jgi:hypothetical protein
MEHLPVDFAGVDKLGNLIDKIRISFTSREEQRRQLDVLLLPDAGF